MLDRQASQTGLYGLMESVKLGDTEAVLELLSKSGIRNVPNFGSHLAWHQYSTLQKLDSDPTALQTNPHRGDLLLTW